MVMSMDTNGSNTRPEDTSGQTGEAESLDEASKTEATGDSLLSELRRVIQRLDQLAVSSQDLAESNNALAKSNHELADAKRSLASALGEREPPRASEHPPSQPDKTTGGLSSLRVKRAEQDALVYGSDTGVDAVAPTHRGISKDCGRSDGSGAES